MPWSRTKYVLYIYFIYLRLSLSTYFHVNSLVITTVWFLYVCSFHVVEIFLRAGMYSLAQCTVDFFKENYDPVKVIDWLIDWLIELSWMQGIDWLSWMHGFINWLIDFHLDSGQNFHTVAYQKLTSV